MQNQFLKISILFFSLTQKLKITIFFIFFFFVFPDNFKNYWEFSILTSQKYQLYSLFRKEGGRFKNWCLFILRVEV